MRPQGPTQRTLWVHGPFSGLVWDAPPELADRMEGVREGRAFVVAENVRFAHNQILSRKGYRRCAVRLNGEPYEGPPLTQLWRSQLRRPDGEPALVAAVGATLYAASLYYDPPSEVYEVRLSGPVWAGTGGSEGRWSFTEMGGRILAARADEGLVWFQPDGSNVRVVPGLPEDIRDWAGVAVHWEHVLTWYQDRVRWSAVGDPCLWVPLQSAGVPYLTRTAADFTQPAPDSEVEVYVQDEPPTSLVPGQWVRIWVGGDTYATYTALGYYEVVQRLSDRLILRALALSGRPATGGMVGAGCLLESVTESDAGEAVLTGSGIEGPIVQVVPAGNYAYLFKPRAVLSVQYTADPLVPFRVNREIMDEGLLAPGAVHVMGDGTVFFLGQKSPYLYRGGTAISEALRPINDGLYDAIHRERLEEIRIVNYDNQKELWISIPLVSGHRIVVWRYDENTIALDRFRFPGAVVDLTMVDWLGGQSWESLPEAQIWSVMDDSFRWVDFTAYRQTYTPLLLGEDGVPRLYGSAWTDDEPGGPYPVEAEIETQDFDFGDPQTWKYVQTLALQYRGAALDPPGQLRVWVGCRTHAGAEVRWREVTPPPVLPAGMHAAETLRWWGNPGGAGRYVRVRIRTQDAGFWAISGIALTARTGNTY